MQESHGSLEPEPVPTSATVRLPFHVSTPSIARTKLAAFLTRNQAEPTTIDDALIVLSEMITNAIAHGQPDSQATIEIRWSINCARDLLELSVHDAGEGATLTPVNFDEDSLSGRGLSIISTVADRWWVDMTSGTRVNAEVTLSEAR